MEQNIGKIERGKIKLSRILIGLVAIASLVLSKDLDNMQNQIPNTSYPDSYHQPTPSSYEVNEPINEDEDEDEKDRSEITTAVPTTDPTEIPSNLSEDFLNRMNDVGLERSFVEYAISNGLSQEELLEISTIEPNKGEIEDVESDLLNNLQTFVDKIGVDLSDLKISHSDNTNTFVVWTTSDKAAYNQGLTIDEAPDEEVLKKIQVMSEVTRRLNEIWGAEINMENPPIIIFLNSHQGAFASNIQDFDPRLYGEGSLYAYREALTKDCSFSIPLISLGLGRDTTRHDHRAIHEELTHLYQALGGDISYDSLSRNGSINFNLREGFTMQNSIVSRYNTFIDGKPSHQIFARRLSNGESPIINGYSAWGFVSYINSIFPGNPINLYYASISQGANNTNTMGCMGERNLLEDMNTVLENYNTNMEKLFHQYSIGILNKDDNSSIHTFPGVEYFQPYIRHISSDELNSSDGIDVTETCRNPDNFSSCYYSIDPGSYQFDLSNQNIIISAVDYNSQTGEVTEVVDIQDGLISISDSTVLVVTVVINDDFTDPPHYMSPDEIIIPVEPHN